MATTVFLADEQRLKLQGHDFLVRLIVCGPQARADVTPFTPAVASRIAGRFPRARGTLPVLTILLGETTPDTAGRDMEILGPVIQCDDDAPTAWDDPAVVRELVREACMLIERAEARTPIG